MCLSRRVRETRYPSRGTRVRVISRRTVMNHVGITVVLVTEAAEKGTIASSVLAALQPLGEPLIYFRNVLTTSSSSYLLKGAVATIRPFSSILVFVLLLCTVFPAAQIGWSFNIMCGSTGDTGSGQACDFSDAWEAADFEDDSPQETVEDCVVSRVSVSDCESSRLHASMRRDSSVHPANLPAVTSSDRTQLAQRRR